MISALNQRLEEKDTFIEVIKEQHETVKQSLTQLNVQVNTSDLVSQLQNDILQLKSNHAHKVKDLDDIVYGLEQTVKSKNKEIDTLKDQVLTLEVKIS